MKECEEFTVTESPLKKNIMENISITNQYINKV